MIPTTKPIPNAINVIQFILKTSLTTALSYIIRSNIHIR